MDESPKFDDFLDHFVFLRPRVGKRPGLGFESNARVIATQPPI